MSIPQSTHCLESFTSLIIPIRINEIFIFSAAFNDGLELFPKVAISEKPLNEFMTCFRDDARKMDSKIETNRTLRIIKKQ